MSVCVCVCVCVCALVYACARACVCAMSQLSLSLCMEAAGAIEVDRRPGAASIRADAKRQAVMLFSTLVRMGKLVLVYEAYPLELEAQLWMKMSPECDFSVGTVVF